MGLGSLRYHRLTRLAASEPVKVETEVASEPIVEVAKPVQSVQSSQPQPQQHNQNRHQQHRR